MRTKISILICIALTLTLCSCSQSQVNTDRLLGGGVNVPSETTTPSSRESINSEEVSNSTDSINNIAVGPAETEEHREISGNVFEEDFFGYGQVNYVINDVRLVDSLTSAGINENTYQLSGSGTYDYYIMISLTIENVDVLMDDTKAAAALINVFDLYSPNEIGAADSITYKPVYFDKGGIANTDTKRYFEYVFPAIGETLDVTIGFGLSNVELSALEENDTPLYLMYTLDTIEMMEINV